MDEDWQVEYLEETNSSESFVSGDEVSLRGDRKTKTSRISWESGTSGQPKQRESEIKLKRLQHDSQGNSGEDITRWTGRETREVLLAYKKFVADMIAANSYRQKRLIWDKIAAEVKMIAPRTCDALMARLKVENMKKTYLKQLAGKGRKSWRYFRLMKDVMGTEASLRNDGFLPVSESDLVEDVSEKKLSKFETAPPLWFRQLVDESKKRHDDVIDVKKKLCRILESLTKR